MSQPAIVVEHLSKKFRIGAGGGPAYHRLSELLTDLPRYAYNQFFPRRSREGLPSVALPPGESSVSEERAAEFWALKDINFEIKQGEVVGIIGRNGAGKSTLLKILSRITEPTSGRFGVRGRVASLLEVGTGFHPELTGRENIYVSGITLGMTCAEIKKRFDEIVDFSGVEKFLDTPVKHYSSGMQVRLGFAVAAHLESEILIVDEVLAVGDAEFQKKCYQKLRNIISEIGTTVLIVSHHLQAIESVAQRCCWLDQGRVKEFDNTLEITRQYNRDGVVRQHFIQKKKGLMGQSRILQSAYLIDQSNSRISSILVAQPFGIAITYSLETMATDPVIGFSIESEDGFRVFATNSRLDSSDLHGPLSGSGEIACRIGGLHLQPGSYFVNLAFSTDGRTDHDQEARAIQLTIEPSPEFSVHNTRDYGVLAARTHWAIAGR